MQNKLQEYLLFTRIIGKEVAAYIASNFLGGFAYREKSASDLVTEVDLYCEKLICNAIHKTYPDHSILAEEGNNKKSDSDWLWLIDPLDGTNNFAHGYPMVSVSIALAFKGDIVMGAVFDVIHDEYYWATKDGGAHWMGRNQTRELKVSKCGNLGQALVSTGFPYDKHESEIDNLGNWNRATKLVRGIRRGGSAALDLCFVAAGRLDGFWELKLKPWDVAAGFLIITEAGGLVTRFDGSPYDIFGIDTLATNGNIHNELKSILRITE